MSRLNADSLYAILFSSVSGKTGEHQVYQRLFERLNHAVQHPMTQRIIECVPNISEGKRPEVIQALRASIQAHKGVVLLDEHMDPDHHRSVLTFAGPPAAVADAAFALVQLATTCIDLTTHQGEHPRIGATDVLPFVPLHGVTMEDCVALARAVGEQIGKELHIPVFLYEAACPTPRRQRLESIRRGGLTGLKARMAADENWQPDFGPNTLHPTAGAIAVGARPFLIAYNVVLQSADLSIAKAIARRIRTSNGGLPALKALGIPLPSRGLTQVSMNLVDFHQTPIHTAFEAVKAEAERHGIPVVESEVVGLVPQEALAQTTAFYLQCPRLTSEHILENRLLMAQDETTSDS